MKSLILSILAITLPFSSYASPLTLSSLPAAGEVLARDDSSNLEEITDTLLFNTSIADFEAARAKQDPPELNWSSDGCTAAPNNPLGFNFLPSCHRHDFGYRNYKAQNRFTSTNKARIDKNFKSDMDNQCAAQTNITHLKACNDVASLYYAAVATFGEKKRRAVMEVDVLRTRTAAVVLNEGMVASLEGGS